MSSSITLETLFLQPRVPISNSTNFANATGNALFSDYSQSALAISTVAQTNTSVKGLVALAVAEADAVAREDLSGIFTDSTGIGLGSPFEVKSNSEAKAIASFAVKAKETFSFDFSANIQLTAKEIKNSNAEYNQAKSTVAFLVLDTTNVNQPKALGYFKLSGNLSGSENSNDLKLKASKQVNIDYKNKESDIKRNNDMDFVKGDAIGTYEQKFKHDTNITIVKVNTSTIELLGDNLIGNLGKDVIYGTLWNDNLKGTNKADKIYGSLGNDRIEGRKGNDIIEGGSGNDTLYGGENDDLIYGGWGDDTIIGGHGNDILAGGSGHDSFIFQKYNSFLHKEYDVIKDFEVGVDKIEFQFWVQMNASTWFDGIISKNQLIDTSNGALLTWNSEKLLFQDVSVSQMSASDFVFV
ncbi:hypothetical protein WA1_40085 [Scytonema hofmannii PCC 7110]|uniref:Uncharacterized protein n=1 Tax=Scytonema hofmannii PCC 7110 TaxID=128403 RepID=A0A139WZ51_9CYAN|nr:M10 family metallopeptidase C-terminal domain-containing protein [Scytonema hofmannii]KYC37663.1 hypothetical protein WA1_40085 [Scytonema hofmannii PCC 7110]